MVHRSSRTWWRCASSRPLPAAQRGRPRFHPALLPLLAACGCNHAEHDWLRFLVRMLLTPLVLAIAFPLRTGVLLAIVLALISQYAARRRSSQGR